MIEFGLVTEATVPFAVPRVAAEILHHGCLAVFVDHQQRLRGLPYHDIHFDSTVRLRGAELIGIYTANANEGATRRNSWPIGDDIRARLAELAAGHARAA